MRRLVKDLFQSADKDNSGVLDKDEFAELVERTNKDSSLPMVTPEADAERSVDPTEPTAHTFNLDAAWENIRKVPFREGKEMGVSFPGFEAWWKDRVGIDDPDIPVLPEFMV
eukprot:COSAG05_NODE_9116_length_646_cov_1.197441_3_plen_111_part_01